MVQYIYSIQLQNMSTYFEILIQEIVRMSEADNFKDAALEWMFIGEERNEEGSECVCTHPIKVEYMITNGLTDHTCIIGSCCIHRFGNRELDQELDWAEKARAKQLRDAKKPKCKVCGKNLTKQDTKDIHIRCKPKPQSKAKPKCIICDKNLTCQDEGNMHAKCKPKPDCRICNYPVISGEDIHPGCEQKQEKIAEMKEEMRKMDRQTLKDTIDFNIYPGEINKCQWDFIGNIIHKLYNPEYKPNDKEIDIISSIYVQCKYCLRLPY